MIVCFVLGASSLAQAQHTGLFPNWQVRRQKQACVQEPPEFRLYRQVYHGYYPTCWRRFPQGWGCQSPEAPNVNAAYEKLPLAEPPAPRNINDLNESGETDMDNRGRDDVNPPRGQGAFDRNPADLDGPARPLPTDPQAAPLPEQDRPRASLNPPQANPIARSQPGFEPASGLRSSARSAPLLAADDTGDEVDPAASASGAPATADANQYASAAPSGATAAGVDPFEAAKPQRRGLIPWLFSSNRPRLFR